MQAQFEELIPIMLPPKQRLGLPSALANERPLHTGCGWEAATVVKNQRRTVLLNQPRGMWPFLARFEAFCIGRSLELAERK